MSIERIKSLDGLRFISISLVIFSHLVKWHHVSKRLLDGYGALGVQMFFVLSGYLITNLVLKEYEHTSTVNLRDFYARRAFRIFPAAFVFLGIVVALYWHEMLWYHVLAASLYLANMDIGRPWMFGHLWSLSIEEQFYLLWPFAVKRWYRHKVTILLCVLLLAPVFRGTLYAFKARNGVTGSLPVFADQLAIGCLLAILAPRLPKITKYMALAMALAVILIPWFPATSRGRTLFMLFVLRPLLDISLAGLVMHVIQVPYWTLNWTPVVWLGKISYSLYLWQELFCSNTRLHFGYSLLLPALACACVSYYFVERPMLRLREKFSAFKRYRLSANGSNSQKPRTQAPQPIPSAVLITSKSSVIPMGSTYAD